MTRHDVIVVGAGINGIVAAATLARAGRDVALLDRNDRIGGFIDSGELTEPGFVHDTYSSWHPLFVGGPGFATFGEDLARHGLTYRNTDGAVTASVGDDGRAVIAHRYPALTAAALPQPGDAEAYLGMIEGFGRVAPAVGAAMGANARRPGGMLAVLDMMRRAGLSDAEALARDVASSGRAYCARRFAGDEVDRLWVPWLLHNGLTPDSALGGFLTPVFAASTHAGGLPVVEGGAARFLDAWEALLAELGVTVVTGAEVERILVGGSRPRATGVQVCGGARYRADEAVLASVSPGALYQRLLPADVVTPARARGAEQYRAGRAAMQIHVSLDAPMTWSDPALDEVPLVHVSDGSTTGAIACAEAQAGLLPRTPTVVVGRQHVLDPSRVPEGRGSLWLQLQEVPSRPVGDAAGTIAADGQWTDDVARAYTERVLDRIAQHAPSLAGSVREIRILTPADLEARNPNAIGGDPYGGSAELDQELLWRPFPAGAASTGVAGLHHIGAAVHPGPGLGGGSGFRVANDVLGAAKRNDLLATVGLGRRSRPGRDAGHAERTGAPGAPADTAVTTSPQGDTR